MTRTVLIIGAGFSGAVTAVQLLRQAGTRDLRVLLLNRNGRLARGLAYGTQSPDHTLNVPAGNMSALAEEPEHFLRYAQRCQGRVGPASFISRRVYGDYLEWLLDNAAATAPPGVCLEHVGGQVTQLTQTGPGMLARLEDGRALAVHQVVLAFGHFPPADPPLPDMSFYASERYVRDPWDASRLAALAPATPLLLLGTGLTAVDICMSLLNLDARRPLIALSRHGLVPQPHRPGGGVPAPGPDAHTLWGDASTVRAQLRALRRHARADNGADWRDVFAALRPATASIWQAWPMRERQRFLRHLQAYWDCHRHRLAPAVHDRFMSAMAAGLVRIQAGRLTSLELDGDGVKVGLRARGADARSLLRVGAVVNCTGPCTRLASAASPLVRQLLAHGMIRTDRLGLGLEVDGRCAVLDAGGTPSERLFYIGPWLKARDWEATAVPELRQVARRLAATLLASP